MRHRNTDFNNKNFTQVSGSYLKHTESPLCLFETHFRGSVPLKITDLVKIFFHVFKNRWLKNPMYFLTFLHSKIEEKGGRGMIGHS
jgi:hypothetical protein